MIVRHWLKKTLKETPTMAWAVKGHMDKCLSQMLPPSLKEPGIASRSSFSQALAVVKPPIMIFDEMP